MRGGGAAAENAKVAAKTAAHQLLLFPSVPHPGAGRCGDGGEERRRKTRKLRPRRPLINFCFFRRSPTLVRGGAAMVVIAPLQMILFAIRSFFVDV